MARGAARLPPKIQGPEIPAKSQTRRAPFRRRTPAGGLAYPPVEGPKKVWTQTLVQKGISEQKYILGFHKTGGAFFFFLPFFLGIRKKNWPDFLPKGGGEAAAQVVAGPLPSGFNELKKKKP